MRLISGAIFLLALAATQPASAQQGQPRLLAVPATSSWQHAETGMILPPASAGLTRGEIRDATDAEMDVSAGYRNEAEGLWATVYLYRTMTPDVALWFDRALTMVMLRPDYRLEGAAAPAPTGFARPGASAAPGLRAAVDVNMPEVRSTAVAVAQLGSWLLKIRLSASGLDRAALDERLTRFIEGLRWPAESAASRIAVPIAPCPTPLRLRQARVVRGDGAHTLIDAMSGIIATDVREAGGPPPPVYCREPGATIDHGVYRPDGATDRYLIALGDAGIALSVGEATNLSALLGGGGGRRFSMTLLERNGTSVYPSFNRLPPPEQAMSVAGTARTTISVSTRAPQNR